MRRALAIAQNDLVLLRQDPSAAIILVLMPLVLAVIFSPAYAPLLHRSGHPLASGAEQAVPGTALMFGIFTMNYGALAFFREYVWATWPRLRAFPLRNSHLLLAKIVPTLLLIIVQQSLLFAAGAVLLGFDVSGSLAGFVAVEAAFVAFLLAMIVATVAVCRTFQQVLAVANLGAILFAAIGGALTPFATLPHWVKAIAPVSPIYWTMRGFNDVLLDHRGFGAVVVPVAVLLAVAAVLFVVAANRFSFDATDKAGTL